MIIAKRYLLHWTSYDIEFYQRDHEYFSCKQLLIGLFASFIMILINCYYNNNIDYDKKESSLGSLVVIDLCALYYFLSKLILSWCDYNLYKEYCREYARVSRQPGELVYIAP